MREREGYRYALSITSQFPYCGLPLRLDTYSSCQFACRYCFASARGGSKSDGSLQLSDVSSFLRRLERVRAGQVRTAIDEFLQVRQPIHLGGMTDPFPPIEDHLAVTRAHLAAVKAFDQPIVVSTKSASVCHDDVLRVIEGAPVAVQISLGTIDDRFGRSIDRGASLPSERLRAMKSLAQNGVRVACRIQPVFPGRESEVLEIIDACAMAGVKHVAVEHLKVPVERSWIHKETLNRALGIDVAAMYQAKGAKRIGREWVLPVEDRLPAMLQYRSVAHSKGLLFGAADNDLLHFSDGQVCCSGADLLGLGVGYKYNYLEAIRRRDSDLVLTLESLEDVWRPLGSISQYVNSRSRISDTSMSSYIEANWSSNNHGSTPLSFYGVSRGEGRDSKGFEVFKLDKAVNELIGSARKVA